MNAADAARSILACPDGLTVIVDGVPQSLEDAPLGVQDWCGTPMFVCQADGELSMAAARRGRALLSVDSALADDESLLLVGRLRRAGSDVCPCCDAQSDVVVLDLADVVLSRAGQRQTIAVRDFVDPALQLNTGYLLRSQEHVNLNHAEHLRLAVARQTSMRRGRHRRRAAGRADPVGGGGAVGLA